MAELEHSALAQAIAHAEGFGVPGAVPTRAHNPGDMVCPWLQGPKMGPEGVQVFPSDDIGWNALEQQLALIRDGRSHVYLSSMNILQMGVLWTRTESAAWTDNVVDWLVKNGHPNATTHTKLSEIL